MSITHVNKIRYQYTADGVLESKEISDSQTGGAEVKIVETFGGLSENTATTLDVAGFEFATADSAKSVYIRLDNCDGTLSSLDSSDVVIGAMVTLTDGVPYVWSGDTSTNFPQGATNPMDDATAGLRLVTSGTNAADVTPVLTVKVLYDPTP